AILVVAADDGVMPQTIEAINHAKAAEVPIIVAINKMDKPTSNPERIKQELTEHGLLVEEWGGDTIAVPVSALKKEGIDDILEMILLVAEVQDLKANPKRFAKGTIVEAELDKGRGPVATILVQNGTLRIGDSIVAGTTYGRVRAMIDDKGRRIEDAGPSIPVEVLGLNEVPAAGDIMYAVEDDKLAKQVSEERRDKVKAQQVNITARTSLDELFSQLKEGEVKDLNIIIKADVHGSVEAIKQALEKLSNEQVRIRIIHGGVGAITESDVLLASASNAIITGFNVRPSINAVDLAEREEIDIRTYRVIYNAIEDIEAAMKGLLDPEFKEVVIGHASVRTTFKVSGIGTIAGSYVSDGKITRSAGARV
ncbi:MAG TPA: translation initiation factor IF-2, partial [Clostridiales bacterium]|nr:translation initiation factor IF-2 [Clostridiales bacterium]